MLEEPIRCKRCGCNEFRVTAYQSFVIEGLIRMEGDKQTATDMEANEMTEDIDLKSFRAFCLECDQEVEDPNNHAALSELALP